MRTTTVRYIAAFKWRWPPWLIRRFLLIIPEVMGTGARAGQFRECGFGFDNAGIVTGDDEDLCAGMDADAKLID